MTTAKSGYILGEERKEAERLVAQAHFDDPAPRMIWGGIQPGTIGIDAGCGPGATSRAMAKLLGPSGKVIAFDLSPARLDEAKAVPPEAGAAPIEYRQGSVLEPPIEVASADFVFCQYVLEYLPNPQTAVDALARLLRPGGALVVCDGDGIGTTQWPMPPHVEEGIPKLLAALGKTGFDAFVGRKLFTYCVRSGLADIDAISYTHYCIPGAAADVYVDAWRQRFVALAPFGISAFEDEAAWKRFVDGYLGMLADTEAFKLLTGVAIRGRDDDRCRTDR